MHFLITALRLSREKQQIIVSVLSLADTQTSMLERILIKKFGCEAQQSY